MRLMIKLPFSFLLNLSVELSCWALPFQTKEIPLHFSDSLMAQDLKKRRLQTWHILLELEGNPHALIGLEHQYSQLWAESQLPLENFLSLSMLYPLGSEKAFPVHCPYYFTVIIKTVRFHSFHMSEDSQCTLFGDILVHWFLMRLGSWTILITWGKWWTYSPRKMHMQNNTVAFA